jgi:hypothetical protein
MVKTEAGSFALGRIVHTVFSTMLPAPAKVPLESFRKTLFNEVIK